MESRNILTATSLFCSQRNWPALLDAIQNFNKTIYKKPSFCIEFNFISGDNIRYSFLTRQEGANQLLKQFDEYFKRFFCGVKPGMKKQNIEIFEGFGQNTIYYGLYNPIIIKKGEKKNYDLQFHLSKIIIAALKDEDNLDDETILTLAYYLVTTVIKIIMENFSVRKRSLINYFEDQYQRVKILEDKVIHDKLRENRSVLLEILNSVGTQEAPEWIRKWSQFIFELVSKWNVEEFEAKTYLLINQIKTQIGLSQAMESMLYYFISRTLLARVKILS